MGYFEMRKKYFSKALDPDLVLDIDALNYISGTNIPDASMYDNNGIATNVGCSTSLYNFRNSINDKIQIPTSQSIRITGSITLECLFRSANNRQNSALLSRWDTGNTLRSCSYSLFMGQDARNNKLGFGLTNGTTAYNLLPIDLTFSTNEWIHIIATADRTTGLMKMYKNGVISSYSNSNFNQDININVNRNITIGTLRQEDSLYNFNGDIMIGRIYKKALTQAEVTARFEEIRGRVGL